MADARNILLTIVPTALRIFVPVQVKPEELYRDRTTPNGKSMNPKLALALDCYGANLAAGENNKHLLHCCERGKMHAPFAYL